MLEAHPFADLFPMLDAADGGELRADIAAHGLRDRVVIYDGRILDGRNRYRALTEIAKLGLAYRGSHLTAVDLVPDGDADSGEFFDYFDGSEADALEFVLSKNLHRRHLNESQRAMVAANLATLGKGRPAHEKTRQMADLSQSEAAARLHVSERSIQRASVVRDHGVDELNDAVQRGALKVSLAAQLARLPADEQARLIREHADPKALSRVAKDMRAEKQAEKAGKREAREQALGAKLAALPDRKYGVIIADPEWRYEVWSEATGRDRSPDNHYPTSELDAIKARPVGDIAADDCALFLWVTTPFLEAGFEVMKSWGFTYKTSIVWGKQRSGAGRGTGYWFLGEHETVLFGTRGNVPAPTPGTQFPSFFLAPVTEHSAKPDTVHEIAEAYFPNLPKIELNARRKRAGWDVWGLEADGDNDEPADHATDDAEGAERLGVAGHDVGEDAAEDSAAGQGQDGSLGSCSDVPWAELAAPEGARSGGVAAPRSNHDDGGLTAHSDADIIRAIGAAVATALGVNATLRAGDSRLLSADERLLRRQVTRIAADDFDLSFNRIRAVLGGCKQGASRLKAAAVAEAHGEMGQKLALVPALVRKVTGGVE